MNSQACIKCDTANEDEKHCGFVKESSEGLNEETCTDTACFSKIYLSEFF